MIEIFSQIQFLFTLAPIIKGFIAVLISATSLPLVGVFVLKQNLVPIRYMLMHGVILGGAISLALNLPLMTVTVVINIFLVFIMLYFSKNSNFGFNGASSGTMVLSMAVASLLMHIKDVPAKDTLNIMWGSPFALTYKDIVVLAVLLFVVVLYLILNYKAISCLFFNKDVALSMGVNVKFNYVLMIFIIAISVAVSMKILGAFLIDSLLIIPVLSANIFLTSLNLIGIKKLFITSSIFGIVYSIIGFILALIFDLPPAATISTVAGVIYIILLIFNRKKK